MIFNATHFFGIRSKRLVIFLSPPRHLHLLPHHLAFCFLFSSAFSIFHPSSLSGSPPSSSITQSRCVSSPTAHSQAFWKFLPENCSRQNLPTNAMRDDPPPSQPREDVLVGSEEAEDWEPA